MKYDAEQKMSRAYTRRARLHLTVLRCYVDESVSAFENVRACDHYGVPVVFGQFQFSFVSSLFKIVILLNYKNHKTCDSFYSIPE